jgi:hypothetical protein
MGHNPPKLAIFSSFCRRLCPNLWGGVDDGRSRMSSDDTQGQKIEHLTPDAMPKSVEGLGDGVQNQTIGDSMPEAIPKTVLELGDGSVEGLRDGAQDFTIGSSLSEAMPKTLPRVGHACKLDSTAPDAMPKLWRQ